MDTRNFTAVNGIKISWDFKLRVIQMASSSRHLPLPTHFNQVGEAELLMNWSGLLAFWECWLEERGESLRIAVPCKEVVRYAFNCMHTMYVCIGIITDVQICLFLYNLTWPLMPFACICAHAHTHTHTYMMEWIKSVHIKLFKCSSSLGVNSKVSPRIFSLTMHNVVLRPCCTGVLLQDREILRSSDRGDEWNIFLWVLLQGESGLIRATLEP